MKIIEEIITLKKKEVAKRRKHIAVRDLENSRHFSRVTLSLSDFILNQDKSGIIAEFKRRTPSGGFINLMADVEKVTKGYSLAGASGLSILTDNPFFGGDCKDLTCAREHNELPVLRKDFIIDEFQVIESKAAGADAILLIAAVLDRKQVLKLATLSRSLKMEILLEIHSLKELEKVNEYVNIIGVNNRDLSTLTTNTGLSLELAGNVPKEFVKISESGISSPQTVVDLRNAGYDGFLIGEYFMKEIDPVKAFVDFIKMIR